MFFEPFLKMAIGNTNHEGIFAAVKSRMLFEPKPVTRLTNPTGDGLFKGEGSILN
jgi:hypothetical protein